VRQSPGSGGTAELVISTHRAPERDLDQTVSDLRQAEAVNTVLSVLRIEGE
jgi:homoserine dehydrogenase